MNKHLEIFEEIFEKIIHRFRKNTDFLVSSFEDISSYFFLLLERNLVTENKINNVWNSLKTCLCEKNISLYSLEKKLLMEFADFNSELLMAEKELSVLWEKGELLKGIFEKTFSERVYPLGYRVMLGRYKKEDEIKIGLNSFLENKEITLVKIFKKVINIMFKKYLYLVKNTKRSDYSALMVRVHDLKNSFEKLLSSIMEMGISLGLSRKNMMEYYCITLGNFEYNSGFCCINNFNEFSFFVRNGYGCYGDKLWDEF